MDQTLNAQFISKDSSRDAGREMRDVADFLDNRFELPFGFRVGWDGIIGLVPGLGDLITNLMAFFIVYRAAMLGCPASVLARMCLNILIDNVLDMIPLLGNFLDFAWKANLMNMALFDQYMANPTQTTRTSRALVFAVMALTACLLIATAVLTFYLARWLWGVFQTAW